MTKETNEKPLRILSLMSGTSADGVDAVLATFNRDPKGLSWEVVARRSRPYSPELRDRILACLSPETSNVLLLTEVHTEVGRVYAELAQEVQQSSDFNAVALSGQTVYHIPRVDPEMNWRTVSTLQVGEAAFTAEATGVVVVSDFRQSDMAAGGQGAPMVSFGDYMLFSKPGCARSIQNLGGIANLTYLPANGDPTQVFAFDTGPANCLVDEAIARHYDKAYDADGKIAASGTVHGPTLNALMTHPYLELAPPKTTGRETFTLGELELLLETGLEPPDLIATLTAFSAKSVAKAYTDFVLGKGLDEIFIAGGGAFNRTLMAMLTNELPVPVRTVQDLGLDPRDREALAFGVMAYYRLLGEPNTLPAATGAGRAVSAGKLSGPHATTP